MNKKDKIENEITIHINSDARLTRKEIEAYLRRTYPLSRFKISDVTGEKFTSTNSDYVAALKVYNEWHDAFGKDMATVPTLETFIKQRLNSAKPNCTYGKERRNNMEDVIVTNPFAGLFYMQVCALKTLTDEQILEAANRLNPCAESSKWSYIERDTKEREPVQCADHADRMHYLIGW